MAFALNLTKQSNPIPNLLAKKSSWQQRKKGNERIQLCAKKLFPNVSELCLLCLFFASSSWTLWCLPPHHLHSRPPKPHNLAEETPLPCVIYCHGNRYGSKAIVNSFKTFSRWICSDAGEVAKLCSSRFD